MPTAIKFISLVNLILMCVFVANLLFMEKAELSYPFANFINLVSAASLLIMTLVTFFRLKKLLGFARLLMYVLALALGLQALLTIKFLFSFYGAFTIAVDVIVIFYAIGVRGYLASEHVATYFSGTKSS